MQDDGSARVAIIGCVGVPANYGGFETLAENLVRSGEKRWTVYCSSRHYQSKPRRVAYAKCVYIPLPANGMWSLIYDMVSVVHAVFTGHRSLLILGTSGAIILPIVKLLFPAVKITVNIDGLEWRREKWGWAPRYFLKFSEKIAVLSANIIVADNKVITAYLRDRYDIEAKTVAYGGDHIIPSLEIDVGWAPEAFDLAICRIEPENNISMILEAAVLASSDLVFIGNWNGSDYGKRLRARFESHQNLLILDPIYDLKRLAYYRSRCRSYLHGHSAGGTNPSLVEAIHVGRPIIAFDCEFNRATLEGKGRYFGCLSDLVRILKDRDEAVDLAIHDYQDLKLKYCWDTIRAEYDGLL